MSWLPASLSGENSIAMRHRRFFARTTEEHDQILKQSFIKAKELSDFIGILIRFTFVMFLLQYFGKPISPAAIWYDRWATGLCWIFSFGLYCTYLWRLTGLTAEYFLRDVTIQKNYALKWFTLISAMFGNAALNYGLFKLTMELAAKSKLG